MKDSIRLTQEEEERYHRQLKIFGPDAQKKLKRATVAVVGLGGLGSPASIYLTAAGVGKMILIDPQLVESSNLNRQILHGEKDIGRKKAESAKKSLRQLNSHAELTAVGHSLRKENVKYLRDVDLVVDALDNFESRYLLNEFCVRESIPFVHGAVEGTQGQVSAIIPNHTPCLKCLVPEPPESRERVSILGTTAGLFGVLQANEAIKILTGQGAPLTGKLLLFDLAENDGNIVDIERDPECPVCGEERVNNRN